MVVLSLVMTTRRAWPSTSMVTILELEADLGGDDLAAGQDRDVLQHGLAAVTEARRLDGDGLKVPRILLTTRVASASPSTSSAMMKSGLPAAMTFSSSGSSSETEEILPWCEEDVGVLEDGLHALGVGHEVLRQVALVELHALGEVELGAHRSRTPRR
jgi:hypothetical protein